MQTETGIKIVRFWTEYKTGADGELVPVDWVEWGPVGDVARTANCERVEKLRPAAKDPSQNPVIFAAQARWEFINARYEAWKAGQAMPETGLPLAAWAGVSPEQANVLRTNDIKTVEELAELTDKHIARIPLPGMRGLVENAKRFLLSFDANKASTQMKALQDENATLREEMAEIKAMLLKSLAEDDKPKRRRRRKPDEVGADAEQEEAA